MSNNLVKTDKFKNAKRSLVNLKKGAPSVIYLPQFPTSGEIFRFTKHNVTGDEANENLVKPLQTTIITLNSHISNLLGFIDEIYGLIDWLDNEYTKGIETAIDAAKESSNQALKASKKAQKASEDASKAQEDIKRTITALQLTVGKLKEFKEITTKRIGELSNDFTKDLARLHQQLDGITREIDESAKQFKSDIAVLQDYKSQLEAYEHLRDVDAIWGDVEKHKKNLTELHQQLDGIAKEISESTKLFKSDIAVLQDYKSQLEAYEHLGSVDAIWGDVEQHKKNLTEFHQQLDGIAKEISETAKLFKSDIAALQDYKSQLEAYEHLGDVDAIWGDVEKHKKNLTELHQQLDGIAKEISESAKLFKSDIAVLQDYKSQLEAYEHLRDVDAIWGDVEKHKKNLTELHQQLDGITKEISESAKLFKSDIAVLQDYKSQLEAYEHLGDVDAIWDNVEQYKKNLTELHQQLEHFTTEYISDRKDIQSSIEKIIEENEQSKNAIKKKIKVAYAVAGFSATITIVQFVLILLHII